MATSQRGKIQREAGRTLTAYAAMTDTGDHQTYTAGTVWSGKAGYEPSIRPNGIVTGRNLLAVHANAETVAYSAFTAYSKGTLHEVSAGSATFTRPTTDPPKAKIYSVTMASDGSVEVVAGVIGTDTTFSETRNAAGGPPYIPADSVEIGQFRITSGTSDALTAEQILQIEGTHSERFDYPGWETFNIGKGEFAATAGEKRSHIKFDFAHPAIHAAAAVKKVYAQYYTPTFVNIAKSDEFVPAATGYSKSSESYYKGAGGSGAIGSVNADSVGDATFTVMADDGLTDGILADEGEVVTVKWYPDANKSAYMLTQGTLGIERTFPSGEQNKFSCTLYAENPSVGFSS
jgi:hypothetical protein